MEFNSGFKGLKSSSPTKIVITQNSKNHSDLYPGMAVLGLELGLPCYSMIRGNVFQSYRWFQRTFQHVIYKFIVDFNGSSNMWFTNLSLITTDLPTCDLQIYRWFQRIFQHVIYKLIVDFNGSFNMWFTNLSLISTDLQTCDLQIYRWCQRIFQHVIYKFIVDFNGSSNMWFTNLSLISTDLPTCDLQIYRWFQRIF